MSVTQHSIKLKPYDSTDLASVTYQNGDVVYDNTNKTLRVMDGVTQGGAKLATQTWVNSNTINSSELTTTLNAYATTASLSSYATTASLSSYATQTYVTTAIGNIPGPATASTTVSGTVKVDGTSIVINSGVISAVTQILTGQIFNAPVGALTAPDYLPCDGSAYLKATYPTLATLLGAPYNVITPTAQTFYTDLRPLEGGFVSLPPGYSDANGTVYCILTNSQVWNNAAAADGGPAIYYSTDNSSWTRVSLPMNSVYYTDITGTPVFLKYLNGAFWACYTDLSNGTMSYRMVKSTDGIVWTDVTDTATWGGDNGFVCDIAHANGMLVLADGYGTLWSSTTGAIGSWTSNLVSGLSGQVSIAYGNNTWVIVLNYLVKYSTDNMLTWTDVNVSWNAGKNQLVFSNGVFVIGNSDGYYYNTAGWTPFYTSTDGITWNTPTIDWNQAVTTISGYTYVGTNTIIMTSNGAGLWCGLSIGSSTNFPIILYSIDNTATWTATTLPISITQQGQLFNWQTAVDASPQVDVANRKSGSVTSGPNGFVFYEQYQSNSTGQIGVLAFEFITRTYNPTTQFITPNVPVVNQGQANGPEFLSYIKT